MSDVVGRRAVLMLCCGSFGLAQEAAGVYPRVPPVTGEDGRVVVEQAICRSQREGQVLAAGAAGIRGRLAEYFDSTNCSVEQYS